MQFQLTPRHLAFIFVTTPSIYILINYTVTSHNDASIQHSQETTHSHKYTHILRHTLLSTLKLCTAFNNFRPLKLFSTTTLPVENLYQKPFINKKNAQNTFFPFAPYFSHTCPQTTFGPCAAGQPHSTD